MRTGAEEVRRSIVEQEEREEGKESRRQKTEDREEVRRMRVID